MLQRDCPGDMSLTHGLAAFPLRPLTAPLRRLPKLRAAPPRRNVLPVNMWGISMGLHVRCGIEDKLWNQARSAKFSTVEQVKQLVRIAQEFGRPIATGKQAKEMLGIGVFYDTVEESLAANGMAPNQGGNQGFLRKAA
jgi:hypothetical protein